MALIKSVIRVSIKVTIPKSHILTGGLPRSLLVMMPPTRPRNVTKILVETDSPYLVPHPLRGRTKRNEPANVLLTAGCLAELRGVSVEKLAAQAAAKGHPRSWSWDVVPGLYWPGHDAEAWKFYDMQAETVFSMSDPWHLPMTPVSPSTSSMSSRI